MNGEERAFAARPYLPAGIIAGLTRVAISALSWRGVLDQARSANEPIGIGGP